MLPSPQPYHGEHDLARMAALLQAGRAARIPAYYPHPGDMMWSLYYPPLGATYWNHITLWDDPADPERLLGWVLLQPGGEGYDVFIHPELYGTPLAASMYAWGETAAAALARENGRQQIGLFWVTPDDPFHTRWLAARGYRIDAEYPALARSLAEPIPAGATPEGFTVRSCKGLPEVETRAWAQHESFSPSKPFAAYLDRFIRFMQSPAYTPDADMVAVSPDGRIAAFAIIWIDEANRVGLFEPVGTHPEFHRLGLGRAVVLEGLRRLKAQGMETAIVCTEGENAAALRLYESAGFRQYNVFGSYVKDLE